MGVQGLWTLLEPVGRRVNIEAISNKKLAVDASIWLFQFMKAMRNERGEMVKNAHLRGFFSRICRLLFHKVRPVFVFDGATPALKRATNIARRRRREAQEVTLRKTAEKLLINQLKKQVLADAKAHKSKRGGRSGSAARGAATTASASGLDPGQLPATGAVASSSTPATAPAAHSHAAVAMQGAGPSTSGRAGPSYDPGPSTSGHAGPSYDPGPSTSGRAGPSDGAGPSTSASFSEADIAAAAAAAAAAHPRSRAQVAFDADLALRLQREEDAANAHMPSSSRALDDAELARLLQGEEDAAGVGSTRLDRDAALALQLQRQGDHDAPAAAALGMAGAGASRGAAATARLEGDGRVDAVLINGGGSDGVSDDPDEQLADAFTAAELAVMGVRAAGGNSSDEERAAANPSQYMHLVPGSSKRGARAPQPRPRSVVASIPLGSSGEDSGMEDGSDSDGNGGAGGGVAAAAALAMLPSDLTKLDAEVLSSLPQSVQLEILEKMRDAQFAENRERFQEAAAEHPEDFSSVQLQTYLKASAFRQQIEGHKKRIGGATVGGDEARRLASDQTREFVFRRDGKPVRDGWEPNRGWGGAGGGQRRGALSKANAAALNAPAAAPVKMAPLATRVALAAFKGTHSAAAAGTHSNGGDATPAVTLCLGAGASARGAGPDRSLAQGAPPRDVHQAPSGGVSLALQLDELAGDGSGSGDGDELFCGPSDGEDGVPAAPSIGGAAAAAASRTGVRGSDGVAGGGGAGDGDGARHGGVQAALWGQLARQARKLEEDQGVLLGAAAAGGHGGEDDMEWEDVGQDVHAGGSGNDDAAGVAAQKTWRDRMAVRQKYWSTSHGFKMGRKLADWSGSGGGSGGGGDDNAPHAPPLLPGAPRLDLQRGVLLARGTRGSMDGGEAAPADVRLGDDDAQLQRAIEMSLEHAGMSGGIPRGDQAGGGSKGHGSDAAGDAAGDAAADAAGDAAADAVGDGANTVGSAVDDVVWEDVEEAATPPDEQLTSAAAGGGAQTKTDGGLDVEGVVRAGGGDEGVADAQGCPSTAPDDASARAARSAATPSPSAQLLSAATPSPSAQLLPPARVSGRTPTPPPRVDGRMATPPRSSSHAQAQHAGRVPPADNRDEGDAAREASPSVPRRSVAAGEPTDASPPLSFAFVAPLLKRRSPGAAAATELPVAMEADPGAAATEELPVAMEADPGAAATELPVAMEADPGAAATEELPVAMEADPGAAATEELPVAADAEAAADATIVPTPVAQVEAAATGADGAAGDDGAGVMPSRDGGVVGPTQRPSASQQTHEHRPPPAHDAPGPAAPPLRHPSQQDEPSASQGMRAPAPAILAGAQPAPPLRHPSQQDEPSAPQGMRAPAPAILAGAQPAPASVGVPGGNAEARALMPPPPPAKSAAARSPAAMTSTSARMPAAMPVSAPGASTAANGSAPRLHAPDPPSAPPSPDPDREMAFLEDDEGAEVFDEADEDDARDGRGAGIGAASAGWGPPVAGRTAPPALSGQPGAAYVWPQPNVASANSDKAVGAETTTANQDAGDQDDDEGFGPMATGTDVLGPPRQLPPDFDFDFALDAVEHEASTLRQDRARAARGAEAPTPEMYAECQELLQLFGLPFVVAPVEAEAQCAWLDSQGLVDGVVTDDNDVFLFGGSHVYRHIFDNKKYVEEYRMSDLEAQLGLNREKLVELAMLLGSDYTEGVAGIGIVNAVEVVHAFGRVEGTGHAALSAFREWLEAPDDTLMQLAAARSGASGAGGSDNGGVAGQEDSDALRKFKLAHRNIRKSWQLPPSFPNQVIMNAYGLPHVDRNKSKFTFGKPDVQLLSRFCLDKFGWQQAQSDEFLRPVLQAYEARTSQLTMDRFLTASFNQQFAKIRSKRLQNAVMQITEGNANPELMLGDVSALPEHGRSGNTPGPKTAGRKRKGHGSGTAAAGGSGDAPAAAGGNTQDDGGDGAPQQAPAQRERKRKTRIGDADQAGGSTNALPENNARGGSRVDAHEQAAPPSSGGRRGASGRGRGRAKQARGKSGR